VWIQTGAQFAHISNEAGLLHQQLAELAEFVVENARDLHSPSVVGVSGSTKGMGPSKVAEVVATDPYAQDQTGFALGE
jgi:hypothetical protein